MKELVNFIKASDITKTNFYKRLKCKKEEGVLLQYLTKEYVRGRDTLVVIDVLSEFYDIKEYEHLDKLDLIKSLLECGWLVQVAFDQIKLNEVSKLELLNSNIALLSSYLKLFENSSGDFILPEIKSYTDHLEYLQTSFSRLI